MEAKSHHGDFDLSTGIYTVKTAGNYLLNFNGLVDINAGSRRHQFDLIVNDKTVATSYNDSDTLGYQPAVIFPYSSPFPYIQILPARISPPEWVWMHKSDWIYIYLN